MGKFSETLWNTNNIFIYISSVFFSRNSNLPLHNLKSQRKHTLRKRKQLTKHAECAMHAAHKISSTQTGKHAPKRWTNTKNMRRRNKVLLGM